MDYISSYSHSGKYYSLKKIAHFDNDGLWFFKSAKFSKHNTLLNTVKVFIDDSFNGYTVKELEKLLKVRLDGSLFTLFKKKIITRQKIEGIYVYLSSNNKLRKKQELCRKDTVYKTEAVEMEPEILLNELKAAIIIFFSLLNEKQRRLYAGLESLKIGYGGDRKIALMLGINPKTVATGRKELMGTKVEADNIRKKGVRTKKVQKKNTRSNE